MKHINTFLISTVASGLKPVLALDIHLLVLPAYSYEDWISKAISLLEYLYSILTSGIWRFLSSHI